MGADFILYATPIPTRGGHPDYTDEAKAAVLAAIDTWNPTDAADLEDMVFDNLVDDFDLNNPRDAAAATVQLRAKLRDAFTDVWGFNREVCTFLGHWVSGGMSWGDRPKSCQLIELLDRSGVTAIELSPLPPAAAGANSNDT